MKMKNGKLWVRNSYHIDTPLLWANLPNEYKPASSLDEFKQKIKY